mgnify:CR=1 FL=1
MYKIDMERYMNGNDADYNSEAIKSIEDAYTKGTMHPSNVIFYKQCDYKAHEMIRRTYNAYLAEKSVLDWLKREEPNAKWQFACLPSEVGMFLVDFTGTANRPDLINRWNETIEVKCNYINEFLLTRFYCYVPTKEGMWYKKFHNPSKGVIIVDRQLKDHAWLITPDYYFNSGHCQYFGPASYTPGVPNELRINLNDAQHFKIN